MEPRELFGANVITRPIHLQTNITQRWPGSCRPIHSFTCRSLAPIVSDAYLTLFFNVLAIQTHFLFERAISARNFFTLFRMLCTFFISLSFFKRSYNQESCLVIYPLIKKMQCKTLLFYCRFTFLTTLKKFVSIMDFLNQWT